MIKRLAFGVILALSISAVVSLLFFNGTILSFAKWFAGSLIAQFILQYIITAILDVKYTAELKRLERDTAVSLSKSVQQITCPCHLKHIQSVQVQFDEPIRYECEKCKKPISAYIEIASALSTIPTDNKQLVPDAISKISAELSKINE